MSEAVDPVESSARASEGSGQIPNTNQSKKRQQHHHRPHLLDESQAEQDADSDPPAPRVGLVQPFPERQGRRRPDQEARRVGIDQVGLAVKPGHQ